MRPPQAYNAACTARIAFTSRALLDTLTGLTAAEALQVLGTLSGLMLARIDPGHRPQAGAIMREQCASTLTSAIRHTAPVAAS